MDYLIKRTAKTERYDCKDDFIDRLLDITSIAEDTGAESLTFSVVEDCGNGHTVQLDHIVNMLEIQIEKYMDLAGKELIEIGRAEIKKTKTQRLFRAWKYVGMYRGLMVVMNTYSLPRYDRLLAKYKEREETIGAMVQKCWHYQVKED